MRSRRVPRVTPQRRRSPAWLGLLILASVPADASETLRFNPNFLTLADGEAARETDLSYFAVKGGQMPGDYRVSVWINDQRIEESTLHFVSAEQHPGLLSPCLSTEQLLRWGIALPHPPDADVPCHAFLAAGDSNLHEAVDLSQMAYRLTVPQAYLLHSDWLRTTPEQWQQGTPALQANYSLNGSKQGLLVAHAQGEHTLFLGTDALVNLGGWRLYNASNYRYGQEGGRFQVLRSYLQHSYGAGQGGEFTLAETATSSEFFDAFPFIGVKLESDDGMLWPALTEYAPRIRGIAASQAQVTVRQSGQVIYQQNVPPGPFEFSDLVAYNGGDLEVTIREADGSERRYTQTAATLPLLQRNGRLKYSLASGRYNGYRQRQQPLFASASAAYGLPWESTLYGGLLLSGRYRSAQLGVGKYDAHLGALAVDASYAESQPMDTRLGAPPRHTGYAYRLAYARGFNSGTALNFSWSHYASQGFYTLADSLDDTPFWHDAATLRVKRRVSLQLSQSLASLGQVSLSGSQEAYWRQASAGSSWTAYWSNSLGPLNVNLALSYSEAPRQAHDTLISLGLSLPLANLLGGAPLSLGNTTTRLNGRLSNQTSLSGSAADGRLNWGLANSWSQDGQSRSQSANLMWSAGQGQLTANYNHYRHGDMLSYGLLGGFALHPGGLTLSRTLSLNAGTALIDAQGVAGVPVKSGGSLQTDLHGYALLPNLTPYQINNVALDVNRFRDDTEAGETDKRVLPARGALIPLRFNVSAGYRALITLRQRGQALPLGAQVQVTHANGVIHGLVGDEGQVYLSGLPPQGHIEAQWNRHPRCQADYQFSGTGLQQLSLECEEKRG